MFANKRKTKWQNGPSIKFKDYTKEPKHADIGMTLSEIKKKNDKELKKFNMLKVEPEPIKFKKYEPRKLTKPAPKALSQMGLNKKKEKATIDQVDKNVELQKSIIQQLYTIDPTLQRPMKNYTDDSNDTDIQGKLFKKSKEIMNNNDEEGYFLFILIKNADLTKDFFTHFVKIKKYIETEGFLTPEEVIDKLIEIKTAKTGAPVQITPTEPVNRPMTEEEVDNMTVDQIVSLKPRVDSKVIEAMALVYGLKDLIAKTKNSDKLTLASVNDIKTEVMRIHNEKEQAKLKTRQRAQERKMIADETADRANRLAEMRRINDEQNRQIRLLTQQQAPPPPSQPSPPPSQPPQPPSQPPPPPSQPPPPPSQPSPPPSQPSPPPSQPSQPSLPQQPQPSQQTQPAIKNSLSADTLGRLRNYLDLKKTAFNGMSQNKNPGYLVAVDELITEFGLTTKPTAEDKKLQLWNYIDTYRDMIMDTYFPPKAVKKMAKKVISTATLSIAPSLTSAPDPNDPNDPNDPYAGMPALVPINDPLSGTGLMMKNKQFLSGITKRIAPVKSTLADMNRQFLMNF